MFRIYMIISLPGTEMDLAMKPAKCPSHIVPGIWEAERNSVELHTWNFIPMNNITSTSIHVYNHELFTYLTKLHWNMSDTGNRYWSSFMLLVESTSPSI